MHPATKKLHWRTFVTLSTWVCKACYVNSDSHQGLPSFAVRLCIEMGVQPISKIPHWQNRMRGLIRNHYTEKHPSWPFKVA